MTAVEPPRRSFSWNVLWFWVGLLIFAGLGVGGYFAGSAVRPGGIAGIIPAFVLLALTAAIGILALRGGNVTLGSGVFVGYALATVLSAGQCTLWAPSISYGFLGGFVYYAMILLGVGVIGVVAAVAEALMRNRRGE